MVKYIAFALLSVLLTIISRQALFNTGSHGFYRFLSWECILWLAIDSVEYWLRNPLRLTQIIAWIFLIYSLILIVSGVALMRKTGKAEKQQNDKDPYNFEKTTVLVDSDIFRYIRHPLYGFLLFLTWRIFFKQPEFYFLIISLMSSVFLIVTAIIEEKENISFFGDRYLDYQNRTKMFVPFLF